ncbi:hypothetical protein B0T14DRAFT_310123 [Immersiella caudata]|uniref:NB-ARC domain-containing protein n=1 Tax=Immersiella caudata TaxID=314043 RepID=A0AA39WFN5_9PEZI|nr:hypothetical protein B0T14DRAFT_310123 [Immersiella caudata]
MEIRHWRNTKFTGRENILSRVELQFSHLATDEAQVVALHGVGGVGKTQVALEFAWRYKEEFDGIFWFDGSSERTLESGIQDSILRILNHYKLNGHQDHPISVAFRDMLGLDKQGVDQMTNDNFRNANEGWPLFHQWLAMEPTARWLLIFDNVDDVESFNIRNFLPRSSGCHIIVTSRRADLSLAFQSVEILELEVKESVEMLATYAGIPITGGSTDEQDAIGLVQTLGYLPLAIAQAGAYMRMQGLHHPIQSYVEIYHRNAARLLQERPSTSTWDYGNCTVFTTWEVSFAAIRQSSPDAAELFLTCGFLDREDIPEHFFRYGHGKKDDDISVELAFRKLRSYSLIQPSPSTHNGYSIHPLVHFWARERLGEKAKKNYATSAIKLLFGALEVSKTSRDFRLDNTSRYMNHYDKVVENLAQLGTPSGRNTYQAPCPLVPFTFVPKNSTKPLETKWPMKFLWGLAAGLRYWTTKIAREEVMGVRDSLARWTVESWTSGLGYRPWAYVMRQIHLYPGPLGDERWEKTNCWILAEMQQALPFAHVDVLLTVSRLAKALFKQERFSESLPWHLWYLDRVDHGFNLDNGEGTTLDTVYYAAVAYWELGMRREARAMLDRLPNAHFMPERWFNRNLDGRMVETLSILSTWAELAMGARDWGLALEIYLGLVERTKPGSPKARRDSGAFVMHSLNAVVAYTMKENLTEAARHLSNVISLPPHRVVPTDIGQAAYTQHAALLLALAYNWSDMQDEATDLLLWLKNSFSHPFAFLPVVDLRKLDCDAMLPRMAWEPKAKIWIYSQISGRPRPEDCRSPMHLVYMRLEPMLKDEAWAMAWHSRTGQALYESGLFSDALGLYQASWALAADQRTCWENYHLLTQMAACLKELGRKEEARQPLMEWFTTLSICDEDEAARLAWYLADWLILTGALDIAVQVALSTVSLLLLAKHGEEFVPSRAGYFRSIGADAEADALESVLNAAQSHLSQPCHRHEGLIFWVERVIVTEKYLAVAVEGGFKREGYSEV